MATKSISWQGFGPDIHLLPGTESRSLRSGLLCCEVPGGPTTSVPSDISSSLEFVPNYKRTRVGDIWQGPGVTVDAKVGTVVASTPPATGPRLRNFLVRPIAGTLVGDPIRVHLHGSIADLWLGPNPMTVHRGIGTGAKFTVYARFDDGVVADITDWWWSIRESGTPNAPQFTWTVPAGSIQVWNSGNIEAYTDSATATVTVTLPALLGGKSAQGQVKAAPYWDAGTQAVLVDGADNEYEDRKNFLFVSDGFDATERNAFMRSVQRIVNSLRRDGLTQPYADLADSTNYWAAFVPSPKRGASPQGEFRLSGASGPGEEIMPVERPGPALKNVLELFNEVGLPVPVDDSGNVSRTQKQQAWNALYESPKLAGLTDRLFARWKSFAKRSLVNDVDTAFGVALGYRPSASQQYPESTAPNERRMSAENVDSFLRGVFCIVETESAGPPLTAEIGERWARDGLDAGLVAFVARSNTFGGSTTKVSETISIYVGIRTLGYAGGVEEPLKKAPAGRGFDLDPAEFPLSYEPSSSAIITCAHEWAHTVGLADEYGENPCTVRYANDRIDASPNLQRLAEIVDQGGQLVGAKIRWAKWPRIRAAAVLKKAPVVNGATVTLEVVYGHSRGFKDGQKVRLRRRRLTPKGLVAVQPGSPQPPLKPHEKPPLESAELTVSGDPSDPKELTLTAATAFDAAAKAKFIADFPPGSVLFLPARAKAGTPEAGQELTLVAPAIIQHITGGGPLNAPKENPTRACTPNPAIAFSRMTPLNLPEPLPATPSAIKDEAEIVGLYEGGGWHGCGVYHPAGVCTFRGEVEGEKRPFCRVCRYAIVDAIDPSKHPLSDDDYAKYYPGPVHE